MEVQQSKDDNLATPEIKQLYRSVYILAKQLDEHRSTATCCSQLFADEPKQLRTQLIGQIDQVMFETYPSIGRKSREILWRKGFYDIISFVKRQWASSKSPKLDPSEKAAQTDEMVKLIHEGISIYRSMIARLNRQFEMDLQNIMDHGDLLKLEPRRCDERYKVETLAYAVETVHAALLSIGDLHRYYIDFNFDNHPPMRRETAARYYHDAFQLNTKLGMAQNQLGTLYSGQRYDLDAMYHYLYSLVSPTPFELSENNVAKIFSTNADYMKVMADDIVGVSIRDFMSRLKLIADIFFYDKTVTDFNALCHCLLIDLRALLSTRRSQLADDFLFKVVGVMMLCLTKLTANKSANVHSLNALMMAVCSEMVDSAIGHLEKFIESRTEQNAKFQETYGALFDLFDRNVRLSRKAIRDDGEHECKKNGNPTLDVKSGAMLVVLESKRKSVTSESSLGSTRKFSNEKASKGDVQRGQSSAEESRKKIPSKMRRRRRRQTSDDSESELESGSEPEDYQMDSDFTSEDSSYAESGDEEVDGPDDYEGEDETLTVPVAKQYSDSEDLIVEEEHLIYRNPHTEVISPDGQLPEYMMDNIMPLADELLKVQLPQGVDLPLILEKNYIATKQKEAVEKLRHKRRYNKIDPNIVIEFAQQECTLQAIKVLFDWLKINPDLLIDCFASNPEFVHKIMRLMNQMNVDMFTRKVCFDRSLVKTTGLRPDLDQLFENRAIIPLQEDLWLKDLPVLDAAQIPLDYESKLQLGITSNEEHMMRLFKLIDFGFFVCKTKQFGYSFCARSRVFVGVVAPKGNGRKNARDRRRNNSQGDKCVQYRGNTARRGKNNGRVRNRPKQIECLNATSNDENELGLLAKNEGNKQTSLPKKSYLKNRNHQQQTASESDADVTIIANNPKTTQLTDDTEKPVASQMTGENKIELMGKLWLRNEVKALESEVKCKSKWSITPYVVIDVSALTDHLAVVNALIKTKNFVVLIPNIVLSELDDMKKNREDARKAIRWLEAEFLKGSRFMRMQRDLESLAIPLLKTPRKYDREIFNFLQVAQFCNYMQSIHQTKVPVLTLLTGNRLADMKSDTFSYSGIMKAISVQFESISTYYAMLKNK